MQHTRFHNQKGFTLIEIIMVAILMGIIALFAGLFIVTSIDSYTSSLENSELVHRAGLAMARITIELDREMDSIVSHSTGGSTNDAIEYIYQTSPDPVRYRHLALVGSGSRKKIVLLESATTPTTPGTSDDEVLVEDVSDLVLELKKYKDDGSGDFEDWDYTNVNHTMANLAKIVITLTLFINGIDADTTTFTTTLSPLDLDDVLTWRMIKPAGAKVSYPA